jgi:hypothetical protein
MPDIRVKVKYEIPRPDKGGFLDLKVPKEEAQEFLEQDAARSGLDPEDFGGKIVQLHDAGYRYRYYIPYFDLEGNPIVDPDGFLRMWRARGSLTPKGVADKRGKYSAPSAKEAGGLTTIPYIHPKVWEFNADGVVAICEGEKKALAILKNTGIPAIGIGGKDNWHPKGDQGRLHTMLEDALAKLAPTQVLVIPDGDVRKYHIAQSYGSFAACLKDHGYHVHMALLPDMHDKIDDLLVEGWGGTTDEERRRAVLNLPPVEDWVETTRRLGEVYNLQIVQRANGEYVPVNDSNIGTLVKNHPAFEDLWYNEDTQRTYIGDRLVDDHVEFDVLCQIQRQFSMPNATLAPVCRAIHAVARTHRARSPWREYLQAQKWDGKERLATWLIDYCNAVDTRLAREGGLKWMVGAVGRAMTPGCKMDYMLVTTGAQGIGKSSIPAILFKHGQIRTIASHLSEVDMYTAMHGSHCANWEELAAMSKYELDHFKIVVTETHDTFRRKYGRSDETRARDFVMYGSTNNANFLPPDATGHRRYVIAEVGQVKFKELEADVDQLWAEAYALWEGGTVDFSQVHAAKNDASRYVRAPDEYDVILERIVADYAKTLDRNSSAVGQLLLSRDGAMSEYRFVMGDMRELAGLGIPKGRQGQALNDYCRGLGWGLKDQAKVNGRKRSKVWSINPSWLDHYV